MCLLIKLDGEWPSDEILRAGVTQNKDGIGIAYSTGEKVQYYKGITFERLMEFKEQGVTHGIIHFRMTSSGPTIPQLCHPFPVSKKTGLQLEGQVNQVLAHNGHWGQWEKAVLENIKHAVMPKGAMSDTRAMAWLTGIHGMGFLRILDEKVLVLTAKYMYQFGKGWEPQPAGQGYQLSYDPIKRMKTTTTTYGSRGHWLNGKWSYEDDNEYESIYADNSGFTYRSFKTWDEWQAHRDAEAAKKKQAIKDAANADKVAREAVPTLTITDKETGEVTTASEALALIEAHEETVAEYIAANNPSTHWENGQDSEIIDFVPENSETYAG